MHQFVKMSAVAVATCLTASSYGVVITENFNNDPTPRGWSGVDNVTADPPVAAIGNDYGFKDSDDTGTAVNPPGGTATANGEIGGVMNRAPSSFYGVNLGGPVDFNSTDMNVKGVLRQMQAKGSSTLNLGWSKGIDTPVNNSGNALYVSWDDGANGSAPGMRARGDNGSGLGGASPVPNLVSGDPTRPFEFDWNSTTNTFSFTLGSSPTSTLVLTEAEVDSLGDLTHWGLWGRTNPGTANADDAGNQLRIDDVTYTTPIPEPASLGLMGLGSLLAIRRRRRSM